MASTLGSSDPQVWLFLREQMSGAADDFHIGETTLKQIKERKGLTLQNCLNLAQVTGKPTDFAFHIYSATMAAAVRLLSDESIRVTYELYCQHDPIVQIIIRPATDPSPNTSRTPSYANSFQARKKLSRGKLVPDLFIAPQQGHVRGSSDVLSGDEITNPSSMVTISLSNVDKVTLTKEYLHGWINCQLVDLVNLTDIEVQALTPSGASRKVKLTDSIWQQSLIRHSWGPVFREIWEKYNNTDAVRKRILAECAQLQKGSSTQFSQGCQNFDRDLRLFSTDKGAQTRLEGVGHEFYIGAPYFVPAVVDKLLSIPTMRETLRDDLRSLQVKRSSGGTDMCASHDLAPLFGSVLMVRWEKENKKAVAMHQGLPSLPSPALPINPGKGKNKSSSSKWTTSTIRDKFKRGKDDKGGKGGNGGKGGTGGSSMFTG